MFQVLLPVREFFFFVSFLALPVCPALIVIFLPPRRIPCPDSQYAVFPLEQVPERPPDSRSLSLSGSAFRLPPMYVPVPTVIAEIGMSFRRAPRSRVSRDFDSERNMWLDAAAGLRTAYSVRYTIRGRCIHSRAPVWVWTFGYP